MRQTSSAARSRLSRGGGLLLAVLAAGCAGPTYIVQQYDGPVRSAETIAVIRINGSEPVGLDSLDGESVGVRATKDSRIHVEVLPGRHAMRVRDLSQPGGFPSRASFLARAGKVYRPVFSQGRARIYEVDADSDATLQDVTEPLPIE